MTQIKKEMYRCAVHKKKNCCMAQIKKEMYRCAVHKGSATVFARHFVGSVVSPILKMV